ncbi:MAG TPA: Ig-like domain repeat protein [Acidobacteriaceae bacterium]
MSTTSYTSLRRLSAFALTLLLFCGFFSNGAEAQATPPIATGSFATTLTAPSGLGTVFQTALDSYGDLVVVDYANGGLYEYPVGRVTPITLIAAGGVGGYANPGIAIDTNNDLYIEANYNNCLLRFPYDTGTNTWDGLSTVTPSNTTADLCPGSGGGTSPYIFAQYGLSITGTYPGYYQPWALALLPGNNLLISNQNSGNFIFSLTVTGSGATTQPGTGQMLLDAMSARAQSITEDKFGNIYFVEEIDQKAPLPGVLMIPAGSAELASDAGLARVDPNLPAVTGVTTDAAGNLYISDSKLGVFMVPNPAGTPQTSAAVILTSLPATGQVTLDAARGLLYVPTSNNVIARVRFNAADLGSTAAGGAAAASQPVLFGFNSAATPASFAIEEAGAAPPDFTLASGGTCAGGTAYAAQSGCTQNVSLSPHAAGSVAAKLVAVDASGKVIGSIALHGTGTGSAVQVLAGAESAIGAGLKTPSQVAVDAGGNVYVADPGLGAVEAYPKGTGGVAAKATVGTGLTAPTGVATDGAGDVFIADSGNVIEVPNGPTGLVAAGQITLKSGLGANLKLATDGVGHLYISDPTNHQVVKLGNLGGSFGLLGQTEIDLSGFNAPSAIATDSNGNLYVADGPNLYQVTPAGVQTTLLTSLSNATGLAVDPSGSVYVAEAGGTVRVPNVGGTLTPSAQKTVAPSVTNATSVAVDSSENVYITDGTAKDVDMVSASSSTNFGTLTSTTGTQANSYTIQNAGNAPLNITGFAATPDYSETSTTCIGAPVAVDATCGVTITFNPGPGDQGTLAGEVLIQSDAANSPVGMNVTGTGASLAVSKTTISVTKPTVDGAPAVITVAPTSGTGAAPTGTVTLTITGTNLTTPVVLTGTLAGGTVTLTPPQLAAGTYTFTVAYQGDRTYGPSTGSTSVTVAAGAVLLVQTPLTPALNLAQIGGIWYVLAGGNGSQEPYDGSTTQYTYTYPVTVAATDGVALIGQPILDSHGKVVAVNYGAVTYQGAPFNASGLGCPPVPVNSNGTAPLDMSCLTIDTSNSAIVNLENTYTITPVYGPTGTGSADCNPTCVVNPNYTSVTGTPITVTALANPVVNISSNPGSLNVTAGSSATATLTLSSVLGYGIGGAGGLLNNYSLPVQLSCDGLPAYATCTFSYPKPDPTDAQSVDVGPAAGTVLSFGGTTGACAAAAPGAIGGCYGPGTVIMTIHTSVSPFGVATLHRSHDEIVFAAMFGLGLFSFAFGKKKSLRARVPTLVCLLLCGGIMMGISGCSTKQLGATSTTVATPAGTYTVLVTARQVGSQTITAVPGITYGNGHQVSLPFSMTLTVQ